MSHCTVPWGCDTGLLVQNLLALQVGNDGNMMWPHFSPGFFESLLGGLQEICLSLWHLVSSE